MAHLWFKAQINRLNPLTEFPQTPFRLFILCSLLVFSSTICVFSPPALAGQDPPARQCCARVFAAGLELGWAEATARLSFQSDNDIITHLNRAAAHIRAANTFCSALNPAWKGHGNMTRQLNALAQKIAEKPTPETREEIADFIARKSPHYAGALRNQIIASRKVHKDTCTANYFLLGFHLARAHYIFQVAKDPGTPAKLKDKLKQSAQRGIKTALNFLQSLEKVKPVTGHCVELWRKGFIKDRLTQILGNKGLDLSLLTGLTQSYWEDALDAMNSGVAELNIRPCSGRVLGLQVIFRPSSARRGINGSSAILIQPRGGEGPFSLKWQLLTPGQKVLAQKTKKLPKSGIRLTWKTKAPGTGTYTLRARAKDKTGQWTVWKRMFIQVTDSTGLKIPFHLSCRKKQNREKGCCCFKGTHTYLFPSHPITKIKARFDTGKKLNCKSRVVFQIRENNKWRTIKTVNAVSSRGDKTVAPTDVLIPVGKKIDGFRLKDGCRCCIDDSEIWLKSAGGR
ncbi:hypothetical protein [Dethiosulfatarculus sandiegensis]|uniref:Uncharacterized protein n=1 Tax=Dethiosulfatarculus sandiegensis TaxID=1429043 RepID=A0A0D2JNI7_9BACT|nr:hypothetical protein [Dethiosulfatarculus sandiegensis]KIX11040.1 hypothetical protein X474_27480 [Dethiosulfatarculus sandiegensis]